MTHVRGSKLREERQTVVTDSEFSEALNRVAQIKDRFLRLWAAAVLCLLRLTTIDRSWKITAQASTT